MVPYINLFLEHSLERQMMERWLYRQTHQWNVRYGLMDGWEGMDRTDDGWTDGRTDGRTNGWRHKCMDGEIIEWLRKKLM